MKIMEKIWLVFLYEWRDFRRRIIVDWNRFVIFVCRLFVLVFVRICRFLWLLVEGNWSNIDFLIRNRRVSGVVFRWDVWCIIGSDRYWDRDWGDCY